MKPRIGIIGFGIVGKAIVHGFAQLADFKIYDINPLISENTFEETVKDSDYIFICTPTPMKIDTGEFDLSILDSVIKKCIPYATKTNKILIIKSTVVPGTTQMYIDNYPHLRIIHNPEFLTARSYRLDFINTSRIILGGNQEDIENVARLYETKFKSTPIYLTDATTAEMVKYTANTFFATKVIFFNEIYDICEKLDIDFKDVRDMTLADGRIGNSHTDMPGHDGLRGFGGLCLILGTKVRELDGICNIEDLSEGKEISNGYGFNKITRFGNRYVDKLYKISSRGRELTGTEDHIHYIYNKENNTLSDILLKDINVGDYVFIPKQEIVESDEVYIGTKPNNYVKFWKDKIKIDKSLARIIGLYLSEGHKNIYKKPKGGNSYEVKWTIGYNQEYLADEIVNTLESIGLTSYKKYCESEGTYGLSKTFLIRCRSQWLYTLLEKLNCGNNCYNKNVKLLPNHISKYIIGGWLDGNGNIYKSTISGYSESKDLINTLDTMFISLGILPSISKNGRRIRVSRKEEIKEISSWCKRLDINFEWKEEKSYKSTNYIYIKDKGWATIVSKTELLPGDEVISLEVEGGTYIANNILTHNCFPKDINGLINRAEQLGIRPTLLKAVWKKNLEVREKKDWEDIPGATS